MSAAPEVVHPQKHGELSDCWNGGLSVRTNRMNLTLPQRLIVVDGSSSGDLKVRKPYTITKQRERWTQDEHQKFLEALKLYGRAWQKIEEHIGTKTAVQIRSHAQKVFSKLERGVSTGSIVGQAEDIDIPPPRPKRKPSHPYPRKAGYSTSADEVDKHPTSSSSSEIVANTESVAFSPSIGNQGSELGASTTVHPQSPFKATNSFGLNGGVKLFGKAVIVPKAQKLVDPMKNLARQSISNSSYTQTSKVNLGRSEGFSPFVRVQKNLTPVSIESSVLQTNQNLGTTTVDEDTDDSAEEACTKDASAGTNEANGADSQSINQNSKVENCKVDTIGNIEDSIKDSGFLKPNPHNNPAYLWMENLFSHYTGAQYKAHEYVDGPPANPLSFWHFLQASVMTNPFHSAAMASWAGLIGSTQKSANEIHSLPSYSGVGSFAPWWNPRGFEPPGQQHSSTVPSCERMLKSTLDVYQIQPTKTTEYTKYVKEHGPKPVSISGMSEVENVVDHKERNAYLEKSNSNVMPEMEIHKVNGLVEQTSDESDDIEKEASDQAHQSFCTSIDEFEVGDGKMDGSSSGSNNPSEGCQLSEAGTPNNLETNKIDEEKNHHPEKLDSRTKSCPKIMFKHIEKRKRYQQRDLKHVCTEDLKRPKGCPHDVDSWKEVSEEGRKAFRALFTSKTLPQTFPRNVSFTMNDDQIDGHISVQNPESEYDDNVRLESLKKTVKEEDGSRNAVKFSVSSRSGFVPYQRAVCNKPKVTCSE